MISLLQRPSEVQLGRKTVLRNGTQVGFYPKAEGRVFFTTWVSDDEAAAIVAEVERLEGVSLTKTAVIPEPTPPEFLEEDQQESPIILP
jgi:hypothetical protein